MLVRLRESGSVLLAGDIVAPSSRSIRCAASIDLRDCSRSTFASVWLHHDLDAQRIIRTAPASTTSLAVRSQAGRR